ncbi:hypothetical protein LTR53_003757 [Teratosphaeriaceae sp. CCFEE 6253]|nr:hypothetical protein LTR53_003757 [Teratosphaeriaceae sp. CCFEE 6253]
MENSPLEGLPQELRDKIYKLVLTQELPLTIPLYPSHAQPSDPDLLERRTPRTSLTKDTLAITRVCKATHADTAELFFKSNNFAIDAYCDDRWAIELADLADMIAAAFTAFATAVGSGNAAAIRELHFATTSIHIVPEQTPDLWTPHADDLSRVLQELRLAAARTAARIVPLVAAIRTFTTGRPSADTEWPKDRRSRTFGIRVGDPAASLRAAATAIEGEDPVISRNGLEEATDDIALTTKFLRHLASELQDPALPPLFGRTMVLESLQIKEVPAPNVRVGDMVELIMPEDG